MIALGLSGFCFYRLPSYSNIYFTDRNHRSTTDFMLQAKHEHWIVNAGAHAIKYSPIWG